MEEQKQRLMTQVPKTAAGFNMDFKALKKDADLQFSYLRRIPLATFKGYFTKTEVETAIFSEILRTLAEKVTSPEESKWAYDFLITLSKAFKFDMIMMFAEDAEVENIAKIVAKIREVDSAKADEIAEKYDD